MSLKVSLVIPGHFLRVDCSSQLQHVLYCNAVLTLTGHLTAFSSEACSALDARTSLPLPLLLPCPQDVFSSGLVPGDTDYRMFSTDYDDVPGMDMVLLLGSQVYHTPMDTVENVM